MSWRLDWDETVDRLPASEAMLEAFLSEIAGTGVERLEQTRLVLALESAGAAEFRDRLDALMQEFAARAVDPMRPRLAVYVALYPGE